MLLTAGYRFVCGVGTLFPSDIVTPGFGVSSSIVCRPGITEESKDFKMVLLSNLTKRLLP